MKEVPKLSMEIIYLVVHFNNLVNLQELIGTELQANLKKISNGLNFYLPPR